MSKDLKELGKQAVIQGKTIQGKGKQQWNSHLRVVLELRKEAVLMELEKLREWEEMESESKPEIRSFKIL